jgi:hypothetical protein
MWFSLVGTYRVEVAVVVPLSALAVYIVEDRLEIDLPPSSVSLLPQMLFLFCYCRRKPPITLPGYSFTRPLA